MTQEALSLIAQEQPGKKELKAQLVELRAKGWSYVRIAKKLKVSKSTLCNRKAALVTVYTNKAPGTTAQGL